MENVLIDGLINACVFEWEGQLLALGRGGHERAALRMCKLHPSVQLLAEIPQPPEQNLEDPRFLGAFEGKAAFICADGFEYYTKCPHHRIPQMVFYVDPSSWIIVGSWRLEVSFAAPIEKNWTPLGYIENNVSHILYAHGSRQRLILHHDRRVIENTFLPGSAEKRLGELRGGTSLCKQSDGTWIGFGHKVGELREPWGHLRWSTEKPQYWGVFQHYGSDFEELTSVTLPLWENAIVNFPSGLVNLPEGQVLLAMGIDDRSTVFLQLELSAVGEPWPKITPYKRFSCLPDCIPHPLGAAGKSEPTICLNMIVKNESRIIERLLTSVVDIIDTFCICDTGSDDGTPEVIRRFFAAKHIQGRLVESQFINFGFTRGFALRAAQDLADYVLLLDADMKLIINSNFCKKKLTADVYTVEQGSSRVSYRNVRLMRTSLGADCVGATHEYYSHGEAVVDHLESLRIDDIGDGGCKADKFERDIRLLRSDLGQNPSNPRTHFYLANSFRDLGKWEQAIPHYERRIELGGWDEEIWSSRLSLGQCYVQRGDFPAALRVWIEAFDQLPRRVENLYEVVKHYRLEGKYQLAARFYDWARSVPKPEEALFLQHDVYEYLLDYEFFILFYYLKDKTQYQPGKIHEIFFNLLARDFCTENVLSNFKFYTQALSTLPGFCRRPLPLESARALASDTPVQSTLSCVFLPDGECIINVRFNNTVLDGDWEYVSQSGRERTRNVSLRSLSDGSVQAALVPDVEPSESGVLLVGRQDIRLFLDSHGELHYTATSCTDEQGERMLPLEYGKYRTGECVGTKMISPFQRRCEKNWSLYEDSGGRVRCIYSWYPLVRGKIEGNTFVEEHRLEVPQLRQARGSSHGVRHKGELWFLVHFVSYEKPRYYFHAFVVVDLDVQTVLRISRLFTIDSNPVEYCGSLNIRDEQVVVHFSVRDATSEELRLPISSIPWAVSEAKDLGI